MGICIIYLMIVLIAFGVFELKNNKVCVVDLINYQNTDLLACL